MTVTIHIGDCRDVLRTLPAESVHTCISSPPYFGLRDYGVDGQIGLEAAPDCLGWATGERCGACFVCVLVDVYREVRRVLRDDGTCWVNLGDSYAATRGSQPPDLGSNSTLSAAARAGNGKGRRVPSMFKPKDLMGMPWRVALALQADGWYLRQDIIWNKPNPMPESVKDRCTKAHEYLFLLAKSPRYYFDAESIKEPLAAASVTRLAQPGLAKQVGSARVPGKTNGNMKAVRAKGKRKTFRGGGTYTNGCSFDNTTATPNNSVGNVPNDLDVRNKRSVWTIATQPYKEAHFATFPVALVEPCVLAGCPVGGTVLDPFGGSGTTGEVAQHLGRSAILIELNPVYGHLSDVRTRQGGLSLGVSA